MITKYALFKRFHPKVFLLIMLVAGLENIIAQSNKYPFEASNFITSPKEYQFLKFGDIPISEYSGIPKIEIPLYEIKQRGISIPLILRYNAQGIKVTEEASSVGLGWDLSLGSITQIVNDKNDLESSIISMFPDYYWYPHPMLYYNNLNPPGISSINMSVDPFSFITYCGPSPTFCQIPVSGAWQSVDLDRRYYYDLSKDIFRFNFGDESFSFTITKVDGKIKCKIINRVGFKVESYIGSNNYFSWKITNPSGTIFYFEEINKCEKSYGTGGKSSFSGVFTDEETKLTTSKINTEHAVGAWNQDDDSRTWQISKIVTIFNDIITFDYERKTSITSLDISHVWKIAPILYYSECHGSGKYDACYNLGPIVPTLPYSHNGNTLDYAEYNVTGMLEDISYLSSIHFKEGSLYFYKSNRVDWNNTLKVDSIGVYNCIGAEVSSIVFNYNYFTSNYCGKGYAKIKKTFEELVNRLKLSSLIVNNEKYTFDYYDEKLPPKNSYGVDYWGFYNGDTTNISMIADLKDFDITKYNFYKTFLDYNNSSRKAKLKFCLASTIRKITYPTGGYSLLNFELNEFAYDITSPFINNTLCTAGGGLRVHNISNYSNDVLANSKIYTYYGGKLLRPLKMYYFDDEKYDAATSCTLTQSIQYSSMITLHSNSLQSTSILGNNPNIGYDKVIILDSIPSGISQTRKIIKYYQNLRNIVPITVGIYPTLVPAVQYGLTNGSLLREEEFSGSNLCRRTSFEYINYNKTPLDYNCTCDYIGNWGNRFGDEYTLCMYQSLDSKRLRVAYYPLCSTESKVSKKTTVDYFNGDSISKYEMDYYNESTRLLNQKYLNASNGAKTEIIVLPDSVSYPSFINTQEQETLRKLARANRLTESVGSYKVLNGRTYLKEVNDYNNNSLLPEISKFAHFESPFIQKEKYTYDVNKNVVEVIGNDGVCTCYLWGYGFRYPIVKIVGLPYSTITSLLLSQISSLGNSYSYTESSFTTIRSTLSNYTALITTYTYKPLVGILTETNERGLTTTYVYDSSNRLKSIIDSDGNILKSYQYHFADQ